MDKKISELTVATSPTGSELIEIVQGGVNKQTTLQDVADLAPAAGIQSVVAGTNVTVDDTDPLNPIVSASGGGGSGTVESVTGDGVDNTDPDNPVLTFPIASEVVFTPAGNISATDVQAAIEEIDTALTNTKSLVIACSDEVTPITATTGKVTFRMPFAMTLSAVRASLTTGQTSGSIFTVDINEGVTSILSTKLTIDNGEKTSTTAATPAVISDSALADDAEITIDVDQIGDTTAKGLKVTLIGS